MSNIQHLCLGTANYGSSVHEKDAFAFLDYFHEHGGSILDSAHVYAAWLADGAGASERCIGNWIRARQNRADISIMTKGAHPDLQTGVKRLNEKDILQDISESLDRLQTDYIDIYWLHRDDTGKSIEDIATWMHNFAKHGYFKAYAVSNWDSERIDALCTFCAEHGLQAPVGNQLGYSLARVKAETGSSMDTRHMQPSSFAWHQKTQFPAYAFSSQASGLFAKCDSFATLLAHEKLGSYKDTANTNLFSIVQEISTIKNISPNQLALAALLHSPFPCFPIIGPRNDQQMHDSVAAAKVQLSQDEISKLFAHWY